MPFQRLFIRARGQIYGPFTIEQIRKAILARRLTPSHEISPDGESWFAAGSVWPELQPPPSETPDAEPRSDTRSSRGPDRSRESGGGRRRRSGGRSSRSGRKPREPSSRRSSRPVAPPPSDRRPLSSAALASPPPAEHGDEDELHDEFVHDVGLPTFSGIAVRIALVVLVLLTAADATWTFIARGAIDRRRDSIAQLNVTRDDSEIPERKQAIVAVEDEIARLGEDAWMLLLARLGCWALVAVLFLIWKYGVSTSLRRMGVSGMAFSPHECIGWYFVPIAQLFKPYQVMKELWSAADSRSVDHWRDGRFGWVNAWWAMFAVGLPVVFLARLGIGRLYRHERPPVQFVKMLELEPIFTVFFVAQAIVFFILITMLSRRLRRKAEAEWKKQAGGSDYA